MIETMINELEEKAASAATKKTYCDKAMLETKMSKEDKEDTIEKLTIQIDVFMAASKKLKSDVLRLDRELMAMANTQAVMDKLRMDEKALYTKNKPVMEAGLEGVKSALKILREYYSKDDGNGGAALIQGSSDAIIGMLEVVESDFSKGIAAMTSEEEAAQSEYGTATQENQVAKATKGQDMKYKKAEFVSLDKSIMDLKTDRTGSHEELAAVQQYFTSIKKDCSGKVDSYEDRKKRRDDEIEGLKEAITSLKDSPSFLQQTMVQKTLRGANARVHH